MKIIEPSFEIIQPGTSEDGLRALQTIERFARISHRSEDKQTEESWRGFITAVVLGHGDWSVVEHALASVIFRVDRGVTHELVRHRLFSFTQESTRFVNGRKFYPEGLEFIRPISLDSSCFWNFEQACINCEREYFDMLQWGIRPQEARSVLPNALAATIAVTGNLRNWRHFFLMRTSKETHPDFRRVTVPLLGEFQKRIPLLYDDIVPEARQIDNLNKAR
jgi:thymidylate synthase (FAD)